MSKPRHPTTDILVFSFLLDSFNFASWIPLPHPVVFIPWTNFAFCLGLSKRLSRHRVKRHLRTPNVAGTSSLASQTKYY